MTSGEFAGANAAGPRIEAMISFERLFNTSSPQRDKFLSRLFGIFNEDPVRIWCRRPEGPFEDLGRPTLTPREGGRGSTLDFCLRRRSDGHIFVSESKCELEYDGHRYLTLSGAWQLTHHTGQAFRRLLQAARTPGAFMVTVRGKPVEVDGAMLVWGRVTDEGRNAVIGATGLADVLSLETIVSDLVKSRNEEFARFVKERAGWCLDLFSALCLHL